jgi:sortase A
MRRLGHILSIALITAGILVVADVGITLAYQEPLSSIYSSIKQGEKESQLKNIESEFLTQSDVQAIDRAKQTKDPKVRKKVESANLSQLAERLVEESKPGDALGRIEAPGMDGLNMVFVQGTDESSLELGPGHYPETAMPGQGKTVAIAGHRTTYLAPFRHMDSVKPGQKIVLTMRYARFTYTVQASRVVNPTAWWITRNVGYDRLVLSACNPLYSASQRIVVFARLAQMVPLGPALGS